MDEKREDEDDDDLEVPSIRKGEMDRSRLYAIASYQRSILLAILVYFILVVGQFFIPRDWRLILGIVGLFAVIYATISVFRLATQVYSVGVGILLGILTLIPCVGLIVLLVINSTATGILRQNGIAVGLLGADLSQFRD